MDIICGDYLKVSAIGNYEYWDMVKEILEYFFNGDKSVRKAMEFFEKEICKAEDGYDVARQINLIRDKLSQEKIDKLDKVKKKLSKDYEYLNNISPVITSFANLFTTSEGEDLFVELVKILCFSYIKKEDIRLE